MVEWLICTASRSNAEDVILNLQTAAVPAFVALLAEHRAFWHTLPTYRVYGADKTFAVVIRNEFSSPNCIVRKVHKK